jgi:hypothetical protein
MFGDPDHHRLATSACQLDCHYRKASLDMASGPLNSRRVRYKTVEVTITNVELERGPRT